MYAIESKITIRKQKYTNPYTARFPIEYYNLYIYPTQICTKSINLRSIGWNFTIYYSSSSNVTHGSLMGQCLNTSIVYILYDMCRCIGILLYYKYKVYYDEL